MIDPTEVAAGDVIALTIKTVYQSDAADPYTGERIVVNIERPGADDEDADERVVLYTDRGVDEKGRSTRRCVFDPDADEPSPVYERLQNGSWMKFSVDGGLTVESATADAVEEAVAETEAEA